MVSKVALILCVTVAAIHVSAACRCSVSAETSACKNDFVIQAKVTGEKIKDNVVTYRLQVERVLKKNKAFSWLIWGGRTVYVDTQENGACRVHMTKGQLYAVTGRVTEGKADVTACDFISPWKDLSEEQIEGIEKKYYTQCDSARNA